MEIISPRGPGQSMCCIVSKGSKVCSKSLSNLAEYQLLDIFQEAS